MDNNTINIILVFLIFGILFCCMISYFNFIEKNRVNHIKLRNHRVQSQSQRQQIIISRVSELEKMNRSIKNSSPTKSIQTQSNPKSSTESLEEPVDETDKLFD